MSALQRLRQTCQHCRFYKQDAGRPTLGYCRRRAPTCDDDFDGVWPVVYKTEWCGEWDSIHPNTTLLTEEPTASTPRVRSIKQREPTHA